MREIKFRGKRIDNGEWAYFNAYGSYIDENGIEVSPKRFIRDCGFKIDPETEGQYTGLKDRNGKEIYEGHVVKGTYEAFNVYFQEYETISFTSDVQWINTGFGVKRKTFNDEGRLRDYGYQLVWDADGVEVIGNIYENPDLLAVNEG